MAGLDVSGLKPLDGGADAPAAAPSAPAAPAAAPFPTFNLSGLKPYDPQSDFAGYASVAGRGLARGAIDTTGAMLKGAALGLDKVGEGMVDMGAAGDVPLPPEMSAPGPAPRVQDNPVYKAGQSVENFGKTSVPMTQAEEASITGQVGRAVGGIAPLVALGAVAPEAALPAGAGMFAASSAGQTFDDAKAKGASDEDAAKAAGFSALVGGGLGVLPLGAILRPVTREAPGLTGWAMAKLEQALQSGAVFGSVGEAQQYLGQKIAQEYYDPNARYSFDPKRLAASLIAGGALGVVHPLSQPKPSSPEAIADFVRQAQTAPGGQQPFSQTRADIDEFLRQQAEREAAAGAPAGTPRLPPPDQGTPQAEAQPAPEPRPGPALSPEYPSLEQEGGPREDPGQQVVASQSGEQLDVSGLRPVEDGQPAAGQPAGAIPQAQADQAANPPGEDLRGRAVLQALLADERPLDQIKTEMQRHLAPAPAVTPAPEQPAPLPPTPGSAAAPIELSNPAAVYAGAEHTEAPTPAQAEAGNYRKRHVRWQGLDIAVETEAGGVRSGVGGDGKPWSVTLTSPYGYIKGVKGRDGDALDAYLGPDPNAPMVYVVDQIDHGSLGFDEHKVMLGYPSRQAAIDAFHQAFSDGLGPARLGAIREMTVPEFKTWIAKGNLKQPVEYGEPVKKARALAKERGINATEEELQEAARVHLVSGADLTDALIDSVERGALAEDRRAPEDVSNAPPQPAAANSTGAAPAPAGEQRQEPVGQEAGGPAPQGVEPGAPERTGSEPAPVDEPDVARTEFTTAKLQKLATSIRDMADSERASARARLNDMLATMDRDGAAIAEHCLQAGAGFSIR
jgi:hypothetical protein